MADASLSNNLDIIYEQSMIPAALALIALGAAGQVMLRRRWIRKALARGIILSWQGVDDVIPHVPGSGNAWDLPETHRAWWRGIQSAGSAGPQMFDNITVDHRGRVLMQEDVGNQAYLGGVWLYDIAGGSLVKVAEHDPARFTPGGSGFLTKDEESSGIVPAPFLGEGWYLLDVQAHYTTTGELVQGGQLLAMHVPPGKFK